MLLVICFCFRFLFPPSKIVYETHLSIDFTTHDHTSLSYSSTLLIQDPRLKFIESRKKGILRPQHFYESQNSRKILKI